MYLLLVIQIPSQFSSVFFFFGIVDTYIFYFTFVIPDLFVTGIFSGIAFRTDYFNTDCKIRELPPFQMKRFVPTYDTRSQLIIGDFLDLRS